MIETIQLKIQVRDIEVKPAVAIHVGSIDTHSCLIAAVFARRDSRKKRDILKPAVVFVNKEKIRPRIIRNCNVWPAVIVEVSQNHAHPLRFGLADARRVAHVREGAVVVVVVELCLLAFVVSRMTVGTIARPMFSTPDINLWSPLNVVRDEQIEPAILVVIKPSCTGRPAALVRNAGLSRDVGECAISVVVVENGVVITGYVKIRVAIVIKVADSHALAVVSFATKTGFCRHVGERSITVVMVESASQWSRRFVNFSGR